MCVEGSWMGVEGEFSRGSQGKGEVSCLVLAWLSPLLGTRVLVKDEGGEGRE